MRLRRCNIIYFFAMVCRQTKDSRSCGKLLSVVKKKMKMTVQQSHYSLDGDKKKLTNTMSISC